ncbi:MAG: pyruvate formate lyase family protein [Anaerohalosphaeraceae bacterium]
MTSKNSVCLSPEIYAYRDSVRQGQHKRFRQAGLPDVVSECEQRQLSWIQRSALLTQRMCEAEKVVIEPHEKIVFTRTLCGVPPIYSPQQWKQMIGERSIHELGPVSNICADWQMVLSQGLLGRRAVALEGIQRYAAQPDKVAALTASVQTLDAVMQLAQRYANQAHAIDRMDIAETLKQVPANPPRTFREALQFLRLCHSVIWMSAHYHVGLGRFDQYMWPYLQSDIQSGCLTWSQAENLLAEFFIVLNKDSDLYPGIQQGDNGQSLMLGGVRRDGSDGVNDLTWMVLRVGCELSLIDPKINLRITPETNLELLTLASEMTRKGLGFPQYSNDAVVIPALLEYGYELEDARDYSVAACWEFLIPGRGMEIVNVGAVSMPRAVHEAICEGLGVGDSFEQIQARAKANIQRQVDAVVKEKSNLLLPPAPYYTALMTDLLEQGKDLSQGAKYNNYGIHGACVSNAADALAAIKLQIFDEVRISPEQLLSALKCDFAGYDSIHDLLKNQSPKVGNNDDRADSMMVLLFDYFAQACRACPDNGRGGKIRPGSGSAMYYVWLANNKEQLGATADGRQSGEYFGANLAPALNVQVAGPVSVLKSFSKIDYRKIVNGGPITIEFSDSVFNTPDSVEKVGMFVRLFAGLGCQQLQLNTLNSDILSDARVHPERHRNLIVRVWGWSGYFCELSHEYQEHIINRAKFKI